MCPIEWHHYRWPLVTLKVNFVFCNLSVSHKSGNTARDAGLVKRVSWKYCMKQCILSFFWPLMRVDCIIGAFWRSVCVIRTTVEQNFDWYRASTGSLGDSWACSHYCQRMDIIFVPLILDDENITACVHLSLVCAAVASPPHSRRRHVSWNNLWPFVPVCVLGQVFFHRSGEGGDGMVCLPVPRRYGELPRNGARAPPARLRKC